jgi:molybdate transport system substrate-binding protein
LFVVGLSIALWSGCRPTGPDQADARQTVVVAAASDLKFALDEIAREFETINPDIEVRISYGSSGNFCAQLVQRAPFDIFFSADARYPARLIEAGLAEASSKFIYATGKIVVWTLKASQIALCPAGLEALKHPSIRRIALANPEHAPYGKAAIAALQKLGIYDTVKERLIYGENVAQAAQFVESGAADAGIIALSLALAPVLKEKGRFWEIPQDSYPRLDQGGVILPWAKHPRASEKLRAFVLSPSGQTVLRSYGFVMPAD